MAEEQTTPDIELMAEENKDVDFTDFDTDEKTEVSEEVKKDEKAEETTKTEEAKKDDKTDEFDLKSIDIKGKWNDEELPVYDMLEKALKYAKENPDDPTTKEVIANIQKAYDYSVKSSEVKAMKKELEERQQLFQVLQTQVLFSELGTPPLEAILDTMNETDGEVKVKKDAQGNEIQYIVYNNSDSLLDHKAKERAFAVKYNEYAGAKQTTATQNLSMETDFKKAHPDVDYTSFITDAGNYINPSASKGLIPFPKDTLEVFYKGKNFDKLVKLEVDKAVKETYEKLGKKQEKASEPVKSEKKEDIKTEKDDSGFDDGLDDFIGN